MTNIRLRRIADELWVVVLVIVILTMVNLSHNVDFTTTLWLTMVTITNQHRHFDKEGSSLWQVYDEDRVVIMTSLWQVYDDFLTKNESSFWRYPRRFGHRHFDDVKLVKMTTIWQLRILCVRKDLVRRFSFVGTNSAKCVVRSAKVALLRTEV